MTYCKTVLATTSTSFAASAAVATFAASFALTRSFLQSAQGHFHQSPQISSHPHFHHHLATIITEFTTEIHMLVLDRDEGGLLRLFIDSDDLIRGLMKSGREGSSLFQMIRQLRTESLQCLGFVLGVLRIRCQGCLGRLDRPSRLPCAFGSYLCLLSRVNRVDLLKVA